MKLLQSFILIAVLVSPAAAQTFTIGSDVRPKVEAGRIVTNAILENGTEPLSNVRVFGWQFQLDESDPYFLNDPGFSAGSDSGLPVSQFNFNVLYKLNYWNGSGAVGFTVPPSGESLRINRGGANVLINAASSAQPGYAIMNISSGGTGHAHLNSFLNGADGNAIPGDGVVAANGIYFTAIDAGISTGSVQRSRAIYLAYNNGMPLATFQTALAYILNPLPGDADFDGRVNTLDFNVLAGNFGGSDRHYFGGDFNDDGTVNSSDFNTLVSGFGQSTTAPPASLPASSVPEPALASLIFPLSTLLRRARRINS